MENTSRPSGRTSPASMSRAAFRRRVDELLNGATDPQAVAAAIRQTAWENDHGRIPIDAPVVVAGVSA